MPTLRVYVSSNIFDDVRDSFAKANVPCDGRKTMPPPGMIWNSPNYLELATESAPWLAVASVIIAWIRAKSRRKVSITTNDNTVIDVEGMSVAEVEAILAQAKWLAMIATTPKNETPSKLSQATIHKDGDGP